MSGWGEFWKPLRKIRIADIFATGTASATTYLRGDGSWSTPAGGSVTSLTKVMTADQSINSSTTLTNVTDLVFAIGANETWAYQFVIPAGAAISTTGVKIAATIPAGASGWIDAILSESPHTQIGGAGSTAHLFNATPSTGLDFDIAFPYVASNDATIRVSIYVATAGTAGNVQLQFAQSTSDASNLTFKQGSFGVGNKV